MNSRVKQLLSDVLAKRYTASASKPFRTCIISRRPFAKTRHIWKIPLPYLSSQSTEPLRAKQGGCGEVERAPRLLKYLNHTFPVQRPSFKLSEVDDDRWYRGGI